MFKRFNWNKASGFNTNTARLIAVRENQSMFDYIRENWNNPNNARSPYKYFAGVLRPKEIDKNGDVVYYYTIGSKTQLKI